MRKKEWKLGLIHVYCGDGKGKTTAAIGLAIRASGNGMKVLIIQFLKGKKVSELEILQRIPNITVLRNDKDYGFYNSMTKEEKIEATKLHNENLYRGLELVETGNCDVLILDEVVSAYNLNLIDKEAVNQLITEKKPELELVLTGRNPDPLFVEKADYVSEIKKIKHPYDRNISARKGIEE